MTCWISKRTTASCTTSSPVAVHQGRDCRCHQHCPDLPATDQSRRRKGSAKPGSLVQIIGRSCQAQCPGRRQSNVRRCTNVNRESRAALPTRTGAESGESKAAPQNIQEAPPVSALFPVARVSASVVLNRVHEGVSGKPARRGCLPYRSERRTG